MSITIEQAKALVAIAETGTISAAADRLSKGHSSIIYLIKSLEDQLDFSVLDRSGYRTKLNKNGIEILRYCRELLITEEKIRTVQKRVTQGWESSLQIIYDGIVDFNSVVNSIVGFKKIKFPTKIKLANSYLQDVDQAFRDNNADFVISILPKKNNSLSYIKLPSFKAYLVARENHQIFSENDNQKISLAALSEQTLITVTGSDNRLGLSTEEFEKLSSFHVTDFYAKKIAIKKGLGFGWLPSYIIKKELEKGVLRKIKTEIKNEHKYQPLLYHLPKEQLGPAALKMLEIFKEEYLPR